MTTTSMSKSNQETKYYERWWIILKKYHHESLIKNEKQWRISVKLSCGSYKEKEKQAKPYKI